MKVWARPSDVAAGSGVAAQLTLMELFVAGAVPGSEFARAWLGARRDSLQAGERVREPFDRLLNRVLYALEEYAIDPAQCEYGDLTDAALARDVQDVLHGLRML
ncbi:MULTISPECIES: colicin immunity domain-containing protein [Nocardia]|uniref:colicin immunity domain-containing protein n=1 Tax=Nocardia TaxID=1817 RepID=UPI0007E94999|nr:MULTISPECIES: colicin immunity domain-containing protein [Nocardia]MBF6275918.1 hypothetical protein [Nocardia nova]OBA51882.1 hypothetical protein A5789_02860 [Nocardia sp. 852002-51101_SCH5132738]OBF66256.1 hypothetical protein A9X06_06850 [Mycobacterium sp. 852002-51759_SCH5129042]